MCICGCGSAKSYRKPITNLRICGCGIEFKFAVPRSDNMKPFEGYFYNPENLLLVLSQKIFLIIMRSNGKFCSKIIANIIRYLTASNLLRDVNNLRPVSTLLGFIRRV